MVVVWPAADGAIQWDWANDPPTHGMRSHSLAPELQTRGFLFEPFDRIVRGLQILYPTDFTKDETDDPVP
jgi:hypothetical protein